jgi:hypothetical protein
MITLQKIICRMKEGSPSHDNCQSQNYNIKKAIQLLIISVSLLIAFVVALYLGSSHSSRTDWFGALLGAFLLATAIAAPTGTYFSIRSIQKKEGHLMVRLLTFTSNLILTLFLLFILFIFFYDIFRLL